MFGLGSNELNIAVAILLAIYSLLIVIIGIWGNSIVPSSCVNVSLRSSIRGLLVTGAMSLTAFCAYFMCGVLCQRNNIAIIPSWLVLITIGFCITNLVMAFDIQNRLSEGDPCFTGLTSQFKSFNSICIGLSFVVLFVMAAIGGNRVWEYMKNREKQASEKMTKIRQEIELNNIKKQKEMNEAEVQRKKDILEKQEKEIANRQKEQQELLDMRRRERRVQEDQQRVEKMDNLIQQGKLDDYKSPEKYGYRNRGSFGRN